MDDECLNDCGNDVRPGVLTGDEECMFTEALTGRYQYCQSCYDEAD